MAERTTVQEAEKLQQQFRAEYPRRQFVIVARSTRHGEMFDILESRTGGTCGHTYTTRAIGEDSATADCPACHEAAVAAYRAGAAARSTANRQAVARHVAFDEYSE